MPNWDNFFESRGKADSLWDDPNRASDIARLIQDHPTNVTLKRGDTVLDAQTVHATRSSSSGREQSGPAGTVSEADLVLIGVQNHTTLDDFNVQRGDKFRLWGTNWTVKLVVSNVSCVIEAHCEGQQ